MLALLAAEMPETVLITDYTVAKILINDESSAETALETPIMAISTSVLMLVIVDL